MSTQSQEHKLSDVFGVSRDIPATYTTRNYVDQLFINSLARDKHLVVFGGSKQGKTSLRKHSLLPQDYIVFQCSNNTTASHLYAGILKEAGASIDITEKKTTKGEFKIRAEFKIESKIPFVAKGEGSLGGEGGLGFETEKESKFFELDPSDPNDIIRVLSELEFSKFIILEDFHYLSEEVQRQVAMDLKAFHEKSKICFIVVGVWMESNRLVMYNGDLAGRLIPIDVDRWEEEDLRKIFSSGETLLNIEISEAVKSAILSHSQGNVGILQEACYRLCEEQGINVTQKNKIKLNNADKIDSIVSTYAREQSGRYQNFLSKFVDGFQKTDLEMYKWITYIIIKAETADLKRGLKAIDIFNKMQAAHPLGTRLLYNNVIQALKNCSKLQNLNAVRPIILDFDTSENELRIVDSGFIIYLASQNKSELLKTIGFEADPSTQSA